MVGAMELGVIFMYAMINVYMINTVPTWDNIYTPLSFTMIMVVGGLLLSQFVILFANESRFTVDRNITMLAVIAIAISLLVTVGKLNLIGDIQTSVAKASELVDGFGSYVILKVALLMASLLIWILPMLNKAKVNPVNLSLAPVLFLASELIGRGLFYSLHMTSGL